MLSRWLTQGSVQQQQLLLLLLLELALQQVLQLT
jgi:hypothetical protein